MLVLVAGDEREEGSHGAGDGYMGFMSTLHEELLFASWPVVDGSWSRRVLNVPAGRRPRGRRAWWSAGETPWCAPASVRW